MKPFPQRAWSSLVLLGMVAPLSLGGPQEQAVELAVARSQGGDNEEPTFALTHAANWAPPRATLPIDALLRTRSRTEVWGVHVVSLDFGDTLFSQGASASMAPASNLKLYTSAAALHVLGPDFRFPTYLLARGELRDGVLYGDLILYGTGDPTLGTPEPDTPSPALKALLDAVRESGIRRVEGQILGDGSFFTGDPRRPSWQPRDLNEWFAAPVSALTFNENMVTLRIQAQRPEGFPGAVLTSPAQAGIPILNESRVQRSGPPVTIRRENPALPIRVTGTLRPSQRDIWRAMTVSNPPAYAASVFRATLQSQGIQVSGGSGALGPADGQPSAIRGTKWFAPATSEHTLPLWTIGIVHSPPVRDLIHRVNRQSHNLYSELLLLAMGRTQGYGSDFNAGLQALRDFLVHTVGVDGEALHVEDGSGLSRLNRTTPADLVRTLAFMDRSSHRDAFLASLPSAGGPRSRELGRMSRTPAEGNLVAKSGTIHRTSALSGMVRTLDGERLLFSIVVNDVPSTWAAKQIEDRIGAQLASFRRPGGIAMPGIPAGTPGFGAASVDEDLR